MLKKATVASFVAFTSLTILSSPGMPSTNNRPLTGKNFPKYTETYIHALFGTHRENPNEIRSYISQIKMRVNECAQSNCEYYNWFIIPTGTFDRECVENAIRIAALNQVVEDGYTIAHEYTHNDSTIKFIQESLRYEILQIYQSGSRLNGALRNYRGEKLKEHIWSLKKEYDARISSMKQTVNEACAISYEFTHDESTLMFIKESLQAEIAQLIQNPQTAGNAFRNYRGNRLRERVWDLKNEFDVKMQVR